MIPDFNDLRFLGVGREKNHNQTVTQNLQNH